MHIKGFYVDLDAPAGIAFELVDIIEAIQERAAETSDEIGEVEKLRDEDAHESELEKEELASQIRELREKVAEMSEVSAEAQAKHRDTLASIMQNLEDMEIGNVKETAEEDTASSEGERDNIPDDIPF